MADSLIQQYPPNTTDTMPLTATVWPWTVRDSRMDQAFPPAARLVYRAIAARAGLDEGKWTTYPSHETVAEDSGVAELYVPRMIKLLKRGMPEKGILPLFLITPRFDERGQQTSNSYLFPAERMWAAARTNTAAKELRLETKRKERDAKADAFTKAGFPVDNLDDQADVVDLAGSAATFTTDAEDITTRNARADAACVAATGGDCLTVATEAPAASQPKPLSAERTQDLEDIVRAIYTGLKRTDLPQDLTVVAHAMDKLLAREGDAECQRIYQFALHYKDPFWYDGMHAAKDGPVAYLDRNFGAIRKQADEAAKKSKAKSKPAPTSKKPWDEANWQRRYDEAQAAKQAALKDQDPNSFMRWDEVVIELEAERAAAIGDAPVDDDLGSDDPNPVGFDVEDLNIGE
jgi:hypothetical protein